jgi:diguanylate cyclase (GGDEF)-like protein/PAS domain S-box-containing protein
MALLIVMNADLVFQGQNNNLHLAIAAITATVIAAIAASIPTGNIDDPRKSKADDESIESMLNEAQRITKTGSWKLDLMTHELWWSDEVYNIFEIDPELFDASYEAFIDLVHPDDRKHVSQAYAESVLNHTTYNIIHRLQFSDGRIKYVNECCKTFYDEDGEPKRSIGTVQDITEKYQTQLALAESEQRLQSILDNTTAVIYLKDLDGRYLLTNTRFQQLFHVTRQDILGKTDYDIFPREMADTFRANDLRVIEEAAPLELDEQALHDGGIHHYISVKFPLYDTDGGIYGICGISTNITARKHAEALQLSQQKILELISRSATSLTDVFEAIIQCAEDQHPCVRGSVLLVDGDVLRHGSAPNLPKAYNMLVDGLEIGPNAGSCGTAAYRGKRVIVTDVATDPLWSDYCTLGAEYGFSACWSEPIHNANGGVVGTFALYRDDPSEPTPDEIALIEAMASLAGIAMERKQYEQRLALAGSEWTQAMDQFDDAICLLDMRRRLQRANKAFYRMTGIDKLNSVNRQITELLRPQGGESTCPFCQSLETDLETTLMLEADSPENPSGLPIEVNIKLVRDEAGMATAILMSIRDLSRIRQVEEHQRLAASVFENTDEGVVITNPKGTIIEANRAATEILGYSREEMIGRNPRMFKSEHHDEGFYHTMWRALMETGQWRGELWNRRKNGAMFPEWQTISSVTDKEGLLTHYVAVFSDISHIKRSQEKLDHLAHYDALTGLPNRLLLIERLEHSIKHAERNAKQFAVIFLDIDQFKHINDSLGHPIGDDLLQRVAANLIDCVRQDDTVSRIGGDEFVLLLDDIEKSEHAGIAAENMMMSFSKPFLLEGHRIHVTASLGITLYPRDGMDAATLLRNADAAMNRAKEEGRNTFQFYTEELTSKALERVLLKNNLNQAIENRQLHLLYQPQIDLHSGKIIGAEALIRWEHPQQGMISPAKFIPVAEECGLIHSIGKWVLHTACIQARAWLDQGLDIGRISVNIAGPQIQRGGLVSEVNEALSVSGLPTSHLELEVTEGFIMQQAEFAIEQLLEIRQLGVTLAIDDFGTGYSSLSYLKKLPIDKLKIDRSFVQDIPDDPDDMAIAEAVIALGKSLRLTVIAEGVETEAQSGFLKEAGCQEVQGFLFSKPIKPEELEKLLPELKT